MNENNIELNNVLKWKKKNSYYYGWIEKIHKFIVRPNSRILQIGCETGDLLASLKPSYGVGIDSGSENIELAKKRFPNLNFQVGDPHSFKTDEKFDYIIICNSLGQWKDIQKIFENMHSAATAETRIIVTYYNYLWEFILKLGSLIKLRRPYKYQNWLAQSDIMNLLNLADFDVIRNDSYVLLPKRIWPITSICNYFLTLLPGVKRLNLINLIVARPAAAAIAENEMSVSVIVPCRNEKGNIEDAVKRTPEMGRKTEIIFVDGNSTDGTVEEIEKQIKLHPGRDIKLIHQGQGKGKGDAVRKGFAAASGDVLTIQDADLTAPPEDQLKLVEKLAHQLRKTGLMKKHDLSQLYGLGQGLWVNEDAQEYVNRLREDRA